MGTKMTGKMYQKYMMMKQLLQQNILIDFIFAT